MSNDYVVDELFTKLRYPSVLFGKELKRETALRICRAQLKLCANLENIVTYWNKHSNIAYSVHSKKKCWLGVLAWLKGSTDWDECYGVNNPFLIASAKIKEDDKESKSA